MPAWVVLDTSFLITLTDKNRKHHATARRYWRQFTEDRIPIYLPTIVDSSSRSTGALDGESPRWPSRRTGGPKVTASIPPTRRAR